jgi:transposase-like protein
MLDGLNYGKVYRAVRIQKAAKMLERCIPVRQCPRCGSFNVHRHRGGSQLKRLAIRLVLMRRYSCMYCNSLYYGFLFTKRLPEQERASREAKLTMRTSKS